MADTVERLMCSVSALASRPDDFPWEIRILPDMGRSCFATRDLAAGEILAYDEPVLFWSDDEPDDSDIARRIISACQGRIHNNVVNYLAAYANASPTMRQRMTGFMTISTDRERTYLATMTTVWRDLADMIWTDAQLHRPLTSRAHIIDLCTRSHLNAHNFRQGHAMLEIASKFNHSCSPNASYNDFTHRGKQYMRIFTIKRVKQGEQIWSTYIGGSDMLAPSALRRAQLQAAKAFFCRCTRCSGPDTLAPLKCPSCTTGRCLRHDDDVEYPWHCGTCRRRWWDAEIMAREGHIKRLVRNIDADMDHGRFPPLGIVQFLLRDALEDLGAGHYLAMQARGVLDELYAFRQATHIMVHEDEDPARIANAWQYVHFLLTIVWRISPVVATNLAVLRIRVLLGPEGHFPLGVAQHDVKKVLSKTETFLRSFWGDSDQDAALIRQSLANDAKCQACDEPVDCKLVVCARCACGNYCSRQCLEDNRDAHQHACQLAQKVGRLLEEDVKIK